MKNKIFYLIAAVVLLLTACNDEYQKSSVTGVTLTRSTVMLNLNEYTIVGAIIEPAGAESGVVWSSNNEQVALVNQFGTIFAVGQGMTTVIATTVVGGKVATCAVYVDAVRVTRIELDKVALYLLPGDSESIVATIFPEDATNKNITWTSSDENVAIVTFEEEDVTNEEGEVTGTQTVSKVVAEGFGNATITATTNDGEFKAHCLVTVSKISVTGLLLSQSAIEGTFGETIQLEAIILPDNATFQEATWTSSNEELVTVSETGLVSFVSKEGGSAVIRATSVDNPMFWAECVVTVLPDMSSIVETVVWNTEIVLSWSAVAIPKARFGDILEAGATLRLYFANVGDDGMVQLYFGDWDGQFGTDHPNYDVDVLRIPQGTDYLDIVLSEEVVRHMMNPSWGSDAILIQGDNATITKISVLVSVGETVETVYDKEIVLSWSAVPIPAANFGENLKAGVRLRLYFSSVGDDGMVQLYFGDWEGQFGTDHPNYDVDVLRIPQGTEYMDIVLSEEVVQHMLHPSWGSDAILIQGDNGTISKIAIVF